jgi:hypothetical protein
MRNGNELFIAAVAGMFGVIPTVFGWILARSASRKRRTRLGALHAEVEFIARLVKLETAVSSSGSSVWSTLPLQRILHEYHSLQQEEQDHHKVPVLHRVRRLLLLIPFVSRPARRFAIMFWLLFASLVWINAYSYSELRHGKIFGEEFRSGLVGSSLMFGLAMVFVRRIGVKFEYRAVRPSYGTSCPGSLEPNGQ